MIDTGLSLFHEGCRLGGTTRPERFKKMNAVCREPEDNRMLLREWFAHPTYDAYWAEEYCTRHFDKMNVCLKHSRSIVGPSLQDASRAPRCNRSHNACTARTHHATRSWMAEVGRDEDIARHRLILGANALMPAT